MAHETRARTAGLPYSHWVYPWLAALAGVVALVRAGSYAGTFTQTYDEPYHIGAAVMLFEARQHIGGVQHPPIARFVQGLPLVLGGVSLPEYRGTTTTRVEAEAFKAGAKALFDSPPGYWRVLVMARLAGLVFLPLALFYLYKLGRWVGGPRVAVLAVVFFSLDPTLLGHSGLVTTDGAAAAGFLVATYHGLRWIASPTWRRAVAAGVAVAFAVGCKFSCLLVIPGLMLALAVRVAVLAWRRRRAGTGVALALAWRRVPPVRQIVVAGLVAFVALWAVYLFDVGPIGDQDIFVKQPEWQRVPQWAKRLPVPMPSFWLGGMILIGHNMKGHTSYLNGQVGQMGWPHYFPEAILLKSPLGMLLAVAAALAVLVVSRRRSAPLRSVLLLLLAGVFLAASIRGRIAIGIRHVLPLLPLLYLFACLQLGRGRRVWLLLPLIVLTAVETAVVHPEYMAYFNPIVGGTRGGGRYLDGSNLDWGQDLKELADWLKSDEARGRPYATQVFTSGGPQLLDLLGMHPVGGLPPGGLLAISKTIRAGSFVYFDPGDVWLMPSPEERAWLAGREPIKRIGASIEVFELPADPAAVPKAAVPTTGPTSAPTAQP